MRDWRHATTGRLRLDEPVEGDAAALLAIHADPASWVHLPSGVVTDPAAGAVMMPASRTRFARDGLAYWSVRDEAGGPVVGRCGCSVPDEAFDADLRAQDPAWGVRDLEAVASLAQHAGFGPPEVAPMPANNLILLFRRTG